MYSMNELDRMLKSIGKEFFVKYFDAFLAKDYTISIINEDYTEKAKRTRISKSKKIFENEQQFEALLNIVNSERVLEETRSKAKQILDKNLTTAST